MKYSICITQFNNAHTVSRSLESILNQIDENFEVIVVDNYSSDGSYELLKKYADSGKIKLFQARCSRGKGRQIAFEESTGEYIVGHMDMDDVFKPRLLELLQGYHQGAEGKVLWVASRSGGTFWPSSIIIAPSKLLDGLGGWNDLQVLEDWELCRRADSKGCYRWTDFSLTESGNAHSERSKNFLSRVRWKYTLYRDCIRTGRPLQLSPRIPPNGRQKMFELIMGPVILSRMKAFRNVPSLQWDKSNEASRILLVTPVSS